MPRAIVFCFVLELLTSHPHYVGEQRIEVIVMFFFFFLAVWLEGSRFRFGLIAMATLALAATVAKAAELPLPSTDSTQTTATVPSTGSPLAPVGFVVKPLTITRVSP